MKLTAENQMSVPLIKKRKQEPELKDPGFSRKAAIANKDPSSNGMAPAPDGISAINPDVFPDIDRKSILQTTHPLALQ